MLLAEGALEILEAATQAKGIHFKDLRQLKNSRTGKTFSANTLSTRLDELEQIGAIKRIVSTTETGRSTVGYKITASGLKALEISNRYEQELSKFLNKQKK